MVEVKPLKILSDYDLKHELARSFFPASLSPPPPLSSHLSSHPLPTTSLSSASLSLSLSLYSLLTHSRLFPQEYANELAF